MTRPCRLYLITPPTIEDPVAFAAQLERALAAGDVAALQIRLKDVPDAAVEAAIRTLAPIARARGVAVILNDRPDLAASLDCDGVHIGQADGPVAGARRMIGPDRILGVTCHDSRHIAMAAAEAGADYVAFGAFFPTATKEAKARADLETLTIWQETMLIPCIAIGGITVSNCRSVAAAGADLLAVSAGVWGHPAGPVAAVRALNAEIDAGIQERATR